jgi:hypothetical protein
MGHETSGLSRATDGISFPTVSQRLSSFRIMLSFAPAVGLLLDLQPRDSPDCHALGFIVYENYVVQQQHASGVGAMRAGTKQMSKHIVRNGSFLPSKGTYRNNQPWNVD